MYLAKIPRLGRGGDLRRALFRKECEFLGLARRYGE